MEQEKKKVFNILTNCTDGWDNDECYSEYVNVCDDCGVKPSPINTSDYGDWVHEQIDYTIKCDLDNMEYSKIKNRTFVITGCIGLWDGTHTKKPKFVKGLVPLMKILWGEGDSHFNIELDTEKGIITARQWSYDDPTGRTRLEARMLNRNGEKWLAAAEERGDVENIKLNSRWWTKIRNIGEIY